MNNFFLNLTHYFKRVWAEIVSMTLLLIIPLGLTILNSFMGEGMTYAGYNIAATGAAPAFMLAFQFFNCAIMLGFLYEDFRGERRWRLRAAPCTLRSFLAPAIIANWIISALFGLVLIAVTGLFFNVYWGNLFVVAAVLALVSLMSIFVAMLLFLFIQKFNVANGMVYIISFGLMVLSGMMFIPLGDGPIGTFLTTYGTPLSLGTNAIVNAMYDTLPGMFELLGLRLGVDVHGIEQAYINIGILAAATLVLGIITAIAAKAKGRRAF